MMKRDDNRLLLFGHRVRTARLARRMTSAALAEALGVTPGAVSQWERNGVVPKQEKIERLSEVLDVPVPFFFKMPGDSSDAPRRYRSLVAATKGARESVDVKIAWLREIIGFLRPRVSLFPVSIPDAGGDRPPVSLSTEDIEAAATLTRRAWGLGDGPISDVTRLIELHGAIVSRIALNASTLDALSQWGDPPLIILNAEKTVAVRCRFDLAHELGHLVLHRNVAGQGTPETHKLMEQQAHRFASTFLFPASAFREEVYSVTSLNAMLATKKRWGVSIQMIVRRAHDLGLISPRQYERAFQDISRRGFRKREPLDDELNVERPSVLAKAFGVIRAGKKMTADQILYEIGLASHDIAAIAALAPGFFETDGWGEMHPLIIAERPAGGSPSPDDGGGEVLQFPVRK